MFRVQKKGESAVRILSKEEYEAFFGITYLPTPYFESSKLLEELRKSCPWLLLHTVVGQEHRSMGSFLHKLLQSGHVAEVAIKWIDEEMGYGLFAENLIAKETFIGQYTGIVRKVSRWKPIASKIIASKLNGYCIRVPTKFCGWNSFIMDAESAGNELRFANHSDRPAMRPFCLIDRGLVHIGFFATREIQPGEELTFDYGKDYWKYRSKKIGA